MNGHTIYDIAHRAGVGIATVSRVINGSERVAEGTRLAVQRAMVELGFRPNHAARQLAVRGPNRPRVAALMPFFSANFYFEVSRPMSNGLASSKIDVFVYDIQDRDSKNRLLDQIVRERSCDGLILCSMGIGDDRREQLERIGLPVICVDYPRPGLPSISVDNRGGGRMAVKHMLQTGSRRLGLISGPATARAFRDREEAFLDTAACDVALVRTEAVTVEDGQRAMSELLAKRPDVDGVVCVNDLPAVGALQELRRRKIDVPDAVQLIGFDDQPLMDVIGLSTVHQPIGALGEWAARSMRELLVGRHDTPPASQQLPVTLIHRKTTRPEAPARKTLPKERV